MHNFYVIIGFLLVAALVFIVIELRARAVRRRNAREFIVDEDYIRICHEGECRSIDWEGIDDIHIVELHDFKNREDIVALILFDDAGQVIDGRIERAHEYELAKMLRDEKYPVEQKKFPVKMFDLEQVKSAMSEEIRQDINDYWNKFIEVIYDIEKGQPGDIKTLDALFFDFITRGYLVLCHADIIEVTNIRYIGDMEFHRRVRI